MTQLFKEDGTVVPVTIIDVNGVVVSGLKNQDKDGYNAILIGKGKKKNPTKAEVGKYAKLGYVPMYTCEVRVSDEDIKSFEIGQEVTPNVFDAEQKVDITGVTKGKGFQGVVKKWGFAGGPKTHGQSDRHRAPGSIGSGTTPGRVYKGKKMAGQMGAVNQTTKNLRVISTDETNRLIAVKGAVPGPKGGVVYIKSSR